MSHAGSAGLHPRSEGVEKVTGAVVELSTVAGPTQASGLRLTVLGTLAFALGWATASAMGEVVGEAWGGEFLHQLGHAIGTVLLIALLSLATWLGLRVEADWIGRCAVATVVGAVIGLAAFLPVIALAPDSLGVFTIALTLHLPLFAAAVAQGWSLRGHVPWPARWAVAWYLVVLTGVAVAWFSSGGVSGARAYVVHPVLSSAADYWWRMVPRSLLGGLTYAVLTALAVPLLRRASAITVGRQG
jgi:hypothetical protein